MIQKSNFNQKISKKLNRSKWLVFTMLIVLVPICIILTTVDRVQSSDNLPDSAIIEKYGGIIHVLPNGKKINKVRITANGGTLNRTDILSIVGDSVSWAHLKLMKGSNVLSPILQAGTDSATTQYTFPCRLDGSGVIGWGLRQQNPWHCEKFIAGSPALKRSSLQNLYFAEKAMAKQNNEKNAEVILQRLQEVNIGYSVAKSELLEWISDSDLRYYNVAIECLNILQNQRLKNDAPDIDKIFYYYKEILGVEELPENPQINQEKLKEAIRRAYNNKNGTDFQLLAEIVEDVEFIQSEVQISPNEDLTLIYVHHLQNNDLVIDVLTGNVTIQAQSLYKGSRYNINQGGSTQIPDFNKVVEEESVKIFFNEGNWSEDMKTLIKSFNLRTISRSDSIYLR